MKELKVTTDRKGLRLTARLFEDDEEIAGVVIDCARVLQPSISIVVFRVDEASTGPVEVMVR